MLPPRNALGDRAAGILGAGYQGVTLGAGNKIMAAARTVLPEALGGEQGFDYGQALQDVTQPTHDYEQRHPLESKAVEFAGSVPTVLATGGAGAVAEAPTLAGRVAALAKEGAAYGGASGLLGSDTLDPATLAKNTLGGAAMGAVAAPIAAPIIGAGTRAVAGGLKTLGDAVSMSGPGDALAAATGATPVAPEEVAQNMIRSSLQTGGVDPAVAAQNVDANSPQTVMELGSRKTVNLGRMARNVPGSTAQQTLDEFTGSRAADTGQRIQQAFTDATGNAPEDAVRTPVQLMVARAENAEPLYNKAFQDEPIPLDAAADDGTTLAKILKRPSARKAMAYADQLAAEQGEKPLSARIFPPTPEAAPLPEPVQSGQFTVDQWNELRAKNPGLPEIAPPPEAPEPNPVDVADLHSLKLKLDDLLGYAKNAGRLPDGSAATLTMQRAIQDTQSKLLQVMDASSPDYATARQTYAGDSAAHEAFTQGQKDFATNTVSPAQIAANKADLFSDSERELYDRGALTSLRAKIDAATSGDIPEASRSPNIVQKIAGTRADTDRLRQLFDDPAQYEQFIEQLAPEALYGKTAKAVSGNSSTAAQLAEMGGGGIPPATLSTARNIALAPTSTMAKVRLGMTLAQHVMGSKAAGLTPEIADALGNELVKTGGSLKEALEAMSRVNPRLAARARLSGLAGGGAGVVAGQP